LCFGPNGFFIFGAENEKVAREDQDNNFYVRLRTELEQRKTAGG